MKCANCQTELPENAGFCPGCGQKVEPVSSPVPAGNVCAVCGAPLEPGAVFCGSCGCKNEVAATPRRRTRTTKPTPKISPKVLRIGAAAVAAVLVIVLLVSLIGGGDRQYTVYIKDQELQYAQLPGGKDPQELTGNFVTREDLDSREMSDYTYGVYSPIVVTADGKRMFYPDKVSGANWYDLEYTLYCRDVTSSKAEPVKIDSGLTSYYMLNEAGNLVTYIKDGKLYQHDLKEKTKIASDVTLFRTTGDGKTLLYMVNDGEDYRLYLKKGNKDAEKIASGVTAFISSNEDLSAIFYRKDDVLYFVNKGKDPEKVASDVDAVWLAGDSGTCYFTKREADPLTIWSLVEDDVGDAESQYIREYFEEIYYDNSLVELYYFDGKESTRITETAYRLINRAAGADVFVCAALTGGDLPQIKLSEYLEGNEDIYSMVSRAFEESSSAYVVRDGQMLELPFEEYGEIVISKDGTKLLVGSEDSKEYELHEVALSGNKIKSNEKIDDDVCMHRFVGQDGDYIYLKDVDDNYAGELYLNGEKVSDDVYNYHISYDSGENRLYYMTDFNSEKQRGALSYWNGKKSTEVDDDVYRTVIVPGGQLLYLKDYNIQKCEGDLFCWNGRKSVRVDDDVVDIMNVEYLK